MTSMDKAKAAVRRIEPGDYYLSITHDGVVDTYDRHDDDDAAHSMMPDDSLEYSSTREIRHMGIIPYRCLERVVYSAMACGYSVDVVRYG